MTYRILRLWSTTGFTLLSVFYHFSLTKSTNLSNPPGMSCFVLFPWSFLYFSSWLFFFSWIVFSSSSPPQVPSLWRCWTLITQQGDRSAINEKRRRVRGWKFTRFALPRRWKSASFPFFFCFFLFLNWSIQNPCHLSNLSRHGW